MTKQLSQSRKRSIKLPSKEKIIEPTRELIKNISTKEQYLKYSSKRGGNTNCLSRGNLIQAANPSLTLKEAQNRGNRVYSSIKPTIKAKEQEALNKGWIHKLAVRKAPRKYENISITTLIKDTCARYVTQSQLVEKESQLRIYLENTEINKREICSINNEFKLLMKNKIENNFTCWEVVNIYWAVFTSNRRYCGLDQHNIYESLEECLVGNYLYLSKIPFETHISLESVKRKPDFELLEHNIYIEVLMCDHNDKRRCVATSRREQYSNRTVDKIADYMNVSLPIRMINGDCTKTKLYEQVKDLIIEFYPNKIPPEFESVCKYEKQNLAHLLNMTEKEIYQMVDDAGGTAKFKNNKFSEYNFLKNNRSGFPTLLSKLKTHWKKKGQERSVMSRQKNSDYMSVQEHIDAIKNCNLKRGIGKKPWKNDRQALYVAWASHYQTNQDLFKKSGILPPPSRFKVSFYVKAGDGKKNLKVAEFIL